MTTKRKKKNKGELTKMPETYDLKLECVRDKVTLYAWKDDGKHPSAEFRGIFLYGIRGFQITVKREGDAIFSGEICTDTEVVAVSGGSFFGEIMDEKLNGSWKNYVKRYEAEMIRNE